MTQTNGAQPGRGFQFSLVKLLALTGWAAIVCVALRTPTPVWAAVVFLLAMVATLAGGLGILFRSGRARTFAVGFFAGCLGYAVCLFVVEKHFGGQFANENEMPTTQLASWLFQRLHPQSAGGFGGGMSGFGGGGPAGGMGGPGGGMQGGFFSVDSSLTAEQGSGSDADTSAAGAPESSELGGAGDAAGAMGGGMGSADGMGGPIMSGLGGLPPPVAIPVYYNPQHFVVIVHSALAVLLGLAGGVIAQCFYAARRDSPDRRQTEGNT
jgi:hypothetical protein